MCIIIFSPTNTEVPQEHLKNSAESNHDGCGAMFSRNGILEIVKDLKYENFIKKLNDKISKEEQKSLPIAYHFRIKTSGKINEENIHPFVANYNNMQIGVMHNGIFSNYGNDESCDTKVFTEKVINNLPNKWWQNNSIIELIENSMSSSKVLMMMSNGNTMIFNKKIWTEENGIQYSNRSYMKLSTFTVVGTHNNQYNRRYYGHPFQPSVSSGRNGLRNSDYLLNGAKPRCQFCDSSLYLESEIKSRACITCPQYCLTCGDIIKSDTNKILKTCESCEKVMMARNGGESIYDHLDRAWGD